VRTARIRPFRRLTRDDALSPLLTWCLTSWSVVVGTIGGRAGLRWSVAGGARSPLPFCVRRW
jgi:hypothetical protein